MATIAEKRALREKGLTYKEIAKELGISRQAVAQVLSKEQKSYFRPWTADRCPYVGLRNWLNENQIVMAELLRRLGFAPESALHYRYRDYLSGRTELRKHTIDKLLEITGLTYEEAFRQEDEE